MQHISRLSIQGGEYEIAMQRIPSSGTQGGESDAVATRQHTKGHESQEAHERIQARIQEV